MSNRITYKEHKAGAYISYRVFLNNHRVGTIFPVKGWRYIPNWVGSNKFKGEIFEKIYDCKKSLEEE